MRKAFAPKFVILSFVALSLSACGHLQHHHGSHSGDAGNAVVVTGIGKERVVPDRFLVRAVASREGQDINAMKQAVDQEVAAVLSLARELGIADKHLRAASLSVQPQWEWQPERKLVGYRVARDMDVTAEGLEAYVRLLEGMTKIGLSEVHPAGSDIGDRDAVEQKALAKAIENARARATVLAEAAGRKLGPVLNIQEQGSSPMVPIAAMEMRAKTSSDESWTPGETEVRQEVHVRFQLQ